MNQTRIRPTSPSRDLRPLKPLLTLPPNCHHPVCSTHLHCLQTRDLMSSQDSHTLPFPASSSNLSQHHTLYTDLKFDYRIGWSQKCKSCRNSRCQKCERKVFVVKQPMGELLTAETQELAICTPCEHDLCPGGRLRIITFCPKEKCGHMACSHCGEDYLKVANCCKCRAGKGMKIGYK